METLKGYIAAAEEGKIRVSEKVKVFWRAKLESHEELLKVLEPTADEELKKQYLEKANQVWQVGLKEVLEKVNKELVGPYALGSSHFPSLLCYPSSHAPVLPSSIIFPSFPNLVGPPEIDTDPNSVNPLSRSCPLMDEWLIFRARFR